MSILRVDGRMQNGDPIGLRFSDGDKFASVEISDGVTVVRVSVSWPDMDRVRQWFDEARRPAETPTFVAPPRIKLSGTLPTPDSRRDNAPIQTPNIQTPASGREG